MEQKRLVLERLTMNTEKVLPVPRVSLHDQNMIDVACAQERPAGGLLAQRLGNGLGWILRGM